MVNLRVYGVVFLILPKSKKEHTTSESHTKLDQINDLITGDLLFSTGWTRDLEMLQNILKNLCIRGPNSKERWEELIPRMTIELKE